MSAFSFLFQYKNSYYNTNLSYGLLKLQRKNDLAKWNLRNFGGRVQNIPNCLNSSRLVLGNEHYLENLVHLDQLGCVDLNSTYSFL